MITMITINKLNCIALILYLFFHLNLFGQAGIFMTEKDFKKNIIVKIDTSSLWFYERMVSAKVNGQKVEYKPDDIFGFRDEDGFIYRKVLSRYNYQSKEIFIKMIIKGAICLYGNVGAYIEDETDGSLITIGEPESWIICKEKPVNESEYSSHISYTTLFCSIGDAGTIIFAGSGGRAIGKHIEELFSFDKDLLTYYENNIYNPTIFQRSIIYYDIQHPMPDQYMTIRVGYPPKNQKRASAYAKEIEFLKGFNNVKFIKPGE
jgi:hypothetical protein